MEDLEERFKKDPINFLLVNSIKYLDYEQMVILIQSLNARLPDEYKLFDLNKK